MKVEGRSKMGWFWFAIAMATLLTFAALVKEGTVKLPIVSHSDAVSASDTTEPELTTTAEPTLTTAEEVTLTMAEGADTTASVEPTLTTAPQEVDPMDTAAVRIIILDNYGKKYHLDENCVAASMIAEENREVVETSIDDVESREYIPCDMCANRG